MPIYALDLRTTDSHFPGIGRYAFNLARAMATLLGPSERLVLMYDRRAPTHWSVAQLRSKRVEVVALDVEVFSIRQQWTIPSVLRRCGADLYHSVYYLMPYRCGVPIVLSVADVIPLKQPDVLPWRKRLAFRCLMRMAVGAAALVIVPSNCSHRDLVGVFPGITGRTVRVPLAADPLFRPPDVGEVARVRTRYRLPGRYVLYVGTNKPHKNLGFLLAAWAEVRAGATELILAGPCDPRYPPGPATTDAARSVRILGSVPETDLPALYAGAECFVFPSRYEGFGLPCLEAMACGTAVVCSNVASLPEVVGDAALTFDPTDVNALRGALDRILTDRAMLETLRERARCRADAFSWTLTAAATLDLYRRTLAST